MSDSNFVNEINKRRTFAIISHPDAGKTTVTEQLLLHGGTIQTAGTIKAKKSSRHAASDWMDMEKQRGISITSSVMRFEYNDKIINLLDTPGHADFSEDTYRTLTAVDSALMVIDLAKGVEQRTRKLMDVCRLRNTPIITFINKLDREGKEPIELLDEIERDLDIKCVPITWPIGAGQRLGGIYHLSRNTIRIYDKKNKVVHAEPVDISDANIPAGEINQLREETELILGACEQHDAKKFLSGRQTPVFFGSALHNLGIKELLDYFSSYAPAPLVRTCEERRVEPDESKLTGFVFKVQANMDRAHHDRIAFLRVCSGQYRKGMKLHHVRLNRDAQISNALTFMAGARSQTQEAWPGDIIGLHNHGTIQVGDTFTEGEHLTFTGIPHFAPELFRRICLRDPLKLKALHKGLIQLGEEGAAQLFKPLNNNDLILGAVGVLQFDVVAWRLREEYGVTCSYDNIPTVAARWIECPDDKRLGLFKHRALDNLAIDGRDRLAYLAPSMVNLNLTMKRWPDIQFHAIREYATGA